MSSIGWVHTVFAVVAMAAGGGVLLLAKGTRWHRTLGHLYVTSMVGLLVTAFSIYDLFGGFGVFHVAAVAATVTVVAGMTPVLLRRPRGKWIDYHAGWMSGSYLGLLCAFAAETGTRWTMPWLAPRVPAPWVRPLFFVVVVGASVAVGAVGGRLMSKYLQPAVAKTPHAMRRERRALLDAEGDGAGGSSAA